MQNDIKTNDGAAWAAILSAALGCAVTGLNTVLAEASLALKNFYNWWDPAGPLTGKTGLGVLFWLVAWLILHRRWQKREFTADATLWRLSLGLIALGWLGTFPPFFQLFATH